MRVRYTAPAARDLERVLDNIWQQSPQGALRVQERMQALIGLLIDYPHIGTPTTRPGIRRLAVSPYPYLVFYRATQGEVVIHAVRHAARKLL